MSLTVATRIGVGGATHPCLGEPDDPLESMRHAVIMPGVGRGRLCYGEDGMPALPKLTGTFAATALRVVMGSCFAVSCEQPDVDGLAEDTEPGSEGGESGSAADTEPGTSDEACAAAGGQFGIVASHSLHRALSELEPRGELSAPGLAVGPEGLWASFLVAEDRDDPEPLGYGMPLDFEGAALESPRRVEGAWAGGRWFPGTTAVLVTHCNDRVPGWTFVDAVGESLSPSSVPPGDPGCFLPPRAAWVSDSSALVAWLDPTGGCDDGSSCVRVGGASPQADGAVFELFDAGDPGSGPSVSVAAGPGSAMVAMVRIDRQLEIVTQPLELDGSPIAQPTATPLPPSAEPGDPLASLDARVVAEPDGSFTVYVGGWGFSMGRMRVGPAGEILEPLTALPPIVETRVWSVYNYDLDGVFARPGGWSAVGGAASGGQVLTLVSALSPAGDLVGEVLLPQYARGVAIASDGARLWALSVSVSSFLYELGCVVP